MRVGGPRDALRAASKGDSNGEGGRKKDDAGRVRDEVEQGELRGASLLSSLLSLAVLHFEPAARQTARSKQQHGDDEPGGDVKCGGRLHDHGHVGEGNNSEGRAANAVTAVACAEGQRVRGLFGTAALDTGNPSKRWKNRQKAQNKRTETRQLGAGTDRVVGARENPRTKVGTFRSINRWFDEKDAPEGGGGCLGFGVGPCEVEEGGVCPRTHHGTQKKSTTCLKSNRRKRQRKAK